MKKIITFTLISLISLTLMACNFKNPNPQYCSLTRVEGVYKCSTEFYAFDSVVSTAFYIDKDTKYDFLELFTGIKEIISEYDVLMDQYNEAEGITNVYAINLNNDQTSVISEKLFNALEYALLHQNVAPETDVLLFNIALQPLLNVWHEVRDNKDCVKGIFYDACPLPSEEELNQPFNTNPDDIILNRDELSIRFNKPDMGIDLGGFAKGYISMLIEDYLEAYNANYIINLGASNILAGGKNISNPNGDYYAIGLTTPSYNPLVNSSYGAAKIIDGYTVVTSGTYQRYFISLDDKDDTFYHHIIDPGTRYPGGGGALAVSLITTDTGLSDILSTAVFLMDFEESLAYVNRTEGLEGIWYFGPDDIRKSDKADDFFTIFETE